MMNAGAFAAAWSNVYLVRPDQHVAARWTTFDETAVATAIARTIGKEG